MLLCRSLGRVVGGFLLTSLFSFAVCGTASAGATLQFSSKGVAVVDGQEFPMADDSTGSIFTSRYVEEIVKGDLKGEVHDADCYGAGSTSAAGAYLGSVACTVHVTADDAYSWTTAMDSSNAGGTDFVVTGGKGKFKGATGKGHYSYDWGNASGDRLTWSMDTTISLP